MTTLDDIICGQVLLQEYMLVDSQLQSIEVFRRGKNKLWTYHAFSPGEDVELAALGISFPLAKVYRNVALSEE